MTPETFIPSRLSKNRGIRGIALDTSSNRDKEINTGGLQDYRMSESADENEIEVFSDSDLESENESVTGRVFNFYSSQNVSVQITLLLKMIVEFLILVRSGEVSVP